MFASCVSMKAVADPGFPVGGGGGAPTSDMGAFWQKRMQKRKNWILLGGRQWCPPGSANGKYEIHMQHKIANVITITMIDVL